MGTENQPNGPKQSSTNPPSTSGSGPAFRAATPVASPRPNEEADYLVAVLLLSQPTIASFAHLAETLLQPPFRLPTEIIDAPGPDRASLRVADDEVVAELLRQPLDTDTWSEACSLSGYWPEVANATRQHQSLLVLSVPIGESGHVFAAMILTAAAAAASTLSPTIAVYWESARTLHQPHDVFAWARRQSSQALPSELWVGVHIYENLDATWSLATTGLRAFGQREVEIRGSRREPDRLHDWIRGLIDYLLTQGPVIRDGDTITDETGHPVKARVRPATWDDQEEVLLLVME